MECFERRPAATLLLALLLSSALLGSDGQYEALFNKCCEWGIDWAQDHNECDKYRLPVNGISVEQQMPCLVTVEICCLRYFRARMCEVGKDLAMQGSECRKSVHPGGEYRKDCCDGCKLGLATGSHGFPCVLDEFTFDYPWDEAFADCCELGKRSIATHFVPGGVEEAPPSSSGNVNDVDECALYPGQLCAHYCLNTPSGFHCECREGFLLHTDGKSCIIVQSGDRCAADNPCQQICKDTGITVQCSCHAGFQLSSDQKSCLDVDECFLNTHACDRNAQICSNTDGGYICLSENGSVNAVQPGPQYGSFQSRQTTYSPPSVPGEVGQCEEGYEFSPTTGTCVDIDECAEGRDACNRDREFCLNNKGGYDCYSKRQTQCPAGYKFNAHAERCDDIDECAERAHTCNLGQQTCVNSLGSYRCVTKQPSDCSAGYRYDLLTGHCLDMDECAENLHDCQQGQLCVNTAGGYQCQQHVLRPGECATGFRINANSGTCHDVDECNEGLHSCDLSRETCGNTHGSYSCAAIAVTLPPPPPPPARGYESAVCSSGYHYNPRQRACADVDECLESLHNCHPQAEECVNVAGSFYCRRRSTTRYPPRNQTHRRYCPTGFAYNERFRQCLDINECQLETHNCIASQRCDNTIGSFTCVRVAGCGTGYTLNHASGQCEDDDECEIGSHHCSLQYECRNILGSFRCDLKVCPIGQKLDDDGKCTAVECGEGHEPDASGNCVDINECSQHNVCRRNEVCVNTVGAYRCEANLRCGQGFEMDEHGANCIDVDECGTGTHECRGGQNCVNRHGGYACQCPAGYTMNAHRDCEDIDECARYGRICTENGDCHNTPGSYVCRCKPGFKQTEDGKTCVDVDECEQTYTCHQKCINTWGTYKCTCNQGYSLGPDARTCQDIDECALWKGKGNLCIGTCVNEPGSYACQCPDGYRMGSDKRTCQDVDECAQGGRCPGADEVCLNTRGGYRCNTIVCPPGYVRDTDHRNRCKKESLLCAEHDAECLHAPLSISFNYITFVTNMKIPASGQVDLFTMRGPHWSMTTVQFALELRSARAPAGVAEAGREYFRLRRTSHNQAVISLIRSIEGPQDIDLELNMKLYASGLYGGQAVAKIFIIVSQHEF